MKDSKTRQKKIVVTVEDPILEVVEKAARSAGDGTTVQDVISEILKRAISASIEDESLDEKDILVALRVSVDEMRSAAVQAESDGDRDLAMDNYLRAASMVVESMSMMNRSLSDHESEMLDSLLEVVDLLKRGTGYIKLPEPSFRINLSSSLRN